MARLVVDTDVASLLLKGHVPDDIAAALVDATLCVTFVTVGELAKWTCLRGWAARNRPVVDRWLRDIAVLPYDVTVART